MLLLILSGLGAAAQTQTFNSSGTYTVPAGVTSITVSAWGGGGAGGGVDGQTKAGGGGEGGSFVRGTITVVPGATYTVVVGNGGTGVILANGTAGQASSFSVSGGGATLFNAIGGAFGAVGNSFGAGGNALNTGNIVSGTSTSNFYGGNGGTATNASSASSGGGGGSAGAGGNGGNGGVLTGGTAGAGSGSPSDPGVVGATGRGSSNDGNGNDGGVPGAGGSGARNANSGTDYRGGNGGNGRVIVIWTCPFPTISSQPSSQTICNGNPVTFTVTGSGASAYQWKKGGVDISGATSTSYNIAAVAGSDAATYTVVLTNACGSVTSNNAVLTVNTPPSISVHPVSQAKCAGNSVTFTVTAAGTSPTYQWRKGGVNISGATLTSYSIASVAASDAATYDVLVSVASCTSLASNGAVLTVNPLPTVYTVNGGGVYCSGGAGAAVGLSNSQSGVNYQLKIGGVATGSPVAGTNAAISFGNQTAAGTYTVDAVNATTSCPQAMTGSVVVSINPLPSSVSVTPSSSTVCELTTSVALTGAGTTTQISTVNSDNFNGTPTYTGSGTTTGNRSQIFTKETSGSNVNSVGTFTSPNGGGIMIALAATALSGNNPNLSTANTLLTSPSINTNNFNSLTLTYNHTYKQGNSGSPTGKVEVSTNGSTWTTLKTFTTNQGGSTSFVADNIVLSNTYLDQSNFQLRFNFASSNSTAFSANSSWWAIDDVLINGNPVPLFSWTANTGGGINGLPGGAGTPSQANKNITVVPTATTTYTITATDAVTGCSNTSAATVTVNPIATVSAGSNQTICSNQTATMNGSFGGGASSATWSSSGTGSFDSNDGNAIYTPSVADKSAGSVVLTYTTNDPAGPCGTVNASMTLTINAIPSITSDPSNATVCENGNTSFSIAAAGTGISYQWRRGTNNLSNGGNISGATSATLTITGALLSDAASDYNCVVSGTCDPSVTSSDVALTVNTAPAVSSVGDISENTSGSCVVAISNAQLLAQVISSGSPTPSVTFNPAAGNFSVGTTNVIATAQNSCATVQANFNVIVTDNENPVLSACPSNIVVNNDDGICGALVTWSAPTATDNCSANVSSNFNSGDLFPVGTTTVNYTAMDPSNNSAGCSFTVTVNDNEAPVAACHNINVTLDVAGNANINAIQINNNSTDNCAIDHFTLSQNAFDCSNLGANNVTLTAYDVAGNFSACPATVSVIPYATAAISSNGNICTGSDASVHVVFNGTAPFNYTISDGTQSVSGSTSNNVEDILIPVPAEGNHSYTITVFSDAVCSGSVSGAAIVTVNPVPVLTMITSISSPSEGCNGTVVQLTANITNGFSFNYTWGTGIGQSIVKFSNAVDGPFVTGPFITSTNTVFAQFGSLIGASGYNVSVDISNACGNSGNFNKWVRGIMSVPGNITGSPIACSNQTGVNYSVVQTVSTAVYNWTFSVPGASFTGQGTNNVSVNFPSFTSGQLCVTAALSCGGSSTSAPRCFAISNTTAQPSVITGPSKVCPGSTNVAYSVNPLSGAASYNWTVPSGVSIVESAPYGNSIHVNFPANYTGAPPISVYGVSVCGVQSTGKSKTVGTLVPNTPGSITGPVAAICNSTVQYSIANVSGATGYTWTIPVGATNFIGQGTTSIQFNTPTGFTNGSVTVQANTNVCSPGTSGLRSISVSGAPATPGIISLNPSGWCVGQTINASVATVSPVPYYNWIITNGSLDAGQGTNNVDVITNNSHVIIQVRASNSCGISGNRTLHAYASCREEEEPVKSMINSLSVSPNPAHGTITLSIDTKQNSGITLVMTDISGRTVLSEKLTATAGLNKYQMNLDHLSKGIYLLQADFAGEIQKTKVVVE
ncbi:MAG TPA: immunoglobulin domain-containing protein [Bacteroidia bacterium]|nr:immunoglobulin domain-containing protein [Bacteroidia bacterium]